MTSDAITTMTSRCDLMLGRTDRHVARLAAGLTVAGAATISLFFAIGEPWGTINDASSLALAITTVPIALGLARRNPRSSLLAVGAGIDVVGVVITTTFNALLITRRMGFDETLLPILGGQALIGCWLITLGVAGWPDPRSRRLASFAVAGGGGLVATAAGIATGGMGSPVAFVGFVAALIGTFGAYALLGRRSRP